MAQRDTTPGQNSASSSKNHNLAPIATRASSFSRSAIFLAGAIL